MKKAVLCILTFSLIGGLLAGCNNTAVNKKDATNNEIKISIANWPKENDVEGLKYAEGQVADMKQKYPNITIVPDQWAYDVNSFLPKAASGQLPTMYNTFFTEPSKIIAAGYACDITDVVKKYGYDKAINPSYLNLITKDDRIYGLPQSGYVMGLACNVNLFKQAGEVDVNGVPKFPDTYQDLAILAKKIKDKTGKAGFFLPTTKNQGGWQFMNIAWSFGANFEEKVDGKWKAVFNSPEGVAALQYVKDLKWKYDVLPDNVLADMSEYVKKFAIDEVAMAFDAPPGNFGTAIKDFKMSKDNIAATKLPSGSKGRNSLMGGVLYMFSPNAKPEEIDACFKWLDVTGFSPNITDDTKKKWEESYKVTAEKGYIVGCEPMSVWVNPERVTAQETIMNKYKNVDMNMFKSFMDYSSVSIRPEEPMNAQELYKLLDSAIQAVLTDKNADPKALLDDAATNFQKNYLDRN